LVAYAPQNLTTVGPAHSARQEAAMDKIWHEPRLDELMSDPMVDILLLRDRISREDLRRVVEEARLALARVPRKWAVQ
jgi:hypothetical protein